MATATQLISIGCDYSWNGDGTDGGDGGRVGYCRAAHLRAASLQSTIQSGGALSVGRAGTAAPQALNAVAASTDQEENRIDDDYYRVADDDDQQQ